MGLVWTEDPERKCLQTKHLPVLSTPSPKNRIQLNNNNHSDDDDGDDKDNQNSQRPSTCSGFVLRILRQINSFHCHNNIDATDTIITPILRTGKSSLSDTR